MSIPGLKDKKKNNNTLGENQMYLGKMPPQAKELEEAVLGTILLYSNVFDAVIEILKPECFYTEQHQRIFKAMESLQHKNFVIDILGVVEELRFREELDLVGGPFYVTTLTNKVISSANVENFSKIIYQKYIQREIIRISGQAISQAYEDSCDAFDLVDETEKEISSINNISSKSYSRIENAVISVVKNIDALRHTKEALTGVDTGYIELNKLTCGWQSPDFVVLAARPSVGKTALALKFAMNAAKSGKGVGFFSLEMNQRQLIQRIISAESGLKLENILRGRLSEDEMEMVNKTASDFSGYNLMIDDKAAPTIYELRNKARKMYKDGARLIIIDYLQLMSGIQNGRSDNREQEISKISRDIKGLAKELDIPIIALSQLSRDVEKRSGVKMPMLSDLRESGAIEQDADIVMFMYRPEYYSINVNENGVSMNGETHIKFGKHRNGTLDTIKLRASLATQQFYNFIEQPKQLGLNGNFRPVAKGEIVSFNEDIEDNPF
jgi:replicative DNA helicase